MTTPTKVHCFFEQSGTFKNEFRKLGIPAEDYDIQNNFGETDHVIDLFAEIENGYDGKPSVFDEIGGGDLIMAFFPCIYFSQQNTTYFDATNINWKNDSMKQKIDKILTRSKHRQAFYEMALMMFATADIRGLRLVVENPYSILHYLHSNFPYKPSIIDTDRRKRGDYFCKPTQYWFVNCEPTKCATFTKPNATLTVNGLSGHQGSLCDEDRSLISPDYARNFIADFILGRPLGGRPQQQDLFAQTEGENKCS